MLEFLWETSSAGTCPATLIFVAAISACHVLIDEAPVRKHPLITHFIRGARQGRASVRAKILSWDLAIVLEGIVKTPFEPLESAPNKLQILKMAFLMAITALANGVSQSNFSFAMGIENGGRLPPSKQCHTQ